VGTNLISSFSSVQDAKLNSKNHVITVKKISEQVGKSVHTVEKNKKMKKNQARKNQRKKKRRRINPSSFFLSPT